MQLVPLEEWYPAMADKWGGRRIPWEDRTHWVHHHTVGGTGVDPLSYARRVADMHYDRWGVPGGYNVFVGADGVLRAMCGLDHQGVHAGTHEWNRRGLGLAYQGDFRTRPPSDVMLDAARELIAAHPLDQTTHRAVRPEPTSCPGDALIDLLPLEVDMPLTDEDIRRFWAFPTLTEGVTAQLALTRAERGVNALLLRDTTDPQTLADLILEGLNDGLAREVADELHRRLGG